MARDKDKKSTDDASPDGVWIGDVPSPDVIASAPAPQPAPLAPPPVLVELGAVQSLVGELVQKHSSGTSAGHGELVQLKASIAALG